MAIETPTHVKRLRLPRDRHLVHGAVAGGAADAFPHVNAVIEKNEIGQLIDARPLNGLLTRQAIAHGRQDGRVPPHLRMTRHAGFRRWDARERRRFDRRMAVTAVDAESADVMLMTEGRGLGEWNILLRGIRRAIDGVDDAPKKEEPEERRYERYSGNAITAFPE